MSLANIGNILARPNTLEEQRLGQAFFAEENTAVITNEADLLSLMTLKEFYKGSAPGDADASAALLSIGREESRYLIESMKVLSKDTRALSQNEASKYNKIKAKFGRDFNGAKQLAMLLKSEADATEYRELILPIVAPLVQARKDGRGGALVSSSSSSSS